MVDPVPLLLVVVAGSSAGSEPPLFSMPLFADRVGPTTQRLGPYQQPTLVDEAEVWLRENQSALEVDIGDSGCPAGRLRAVPPTTSTWRPVAPCAPSSPPPVETVSRGPHVQRRRRRATRTPWRPATSLGSPPGQGSAWAVRHCRSTSSGSSGPDRARRCSRHGPQTRTLPLVRRPTIRLPRDV